MPNYAYEYVELKPDTEGFIEYYKNNLSNFHTGLGGKIASSCCKELDKFISLSPEEQRKDTLSVKYDIDRFLRETNNDNEGIRYLLTKYACVVCIQQCRIIEDIQIQINQQISSYDWNFHYNQRYLKVPQTYFLKMRDIIDTTQWNVRRINGTKITDDFRNTIFRKFKLYIDMHCNMFSIDTKTTGDKVIEGAENIFFYIIAFIIFIVVFGLVATCLTSR